MLCGAELLLFFLIFFYYSRRAGAWLTGICLHRQARALPFAQVHWGIRSMDSIFGLTPRESETGRSADYTRTLTV